MKIKRWKKLYGQTIGFVCPYCLKVVPVAEASVEHEPPLSRQEELGPSRTYLACQKCNNEKGSLTADEYALWKYLEFIRHGGKEK
jgi:5-methylcytosine-specific restriction endonuclease McrA